MSTQCETSCSVPSLENSEAACDCSSNTPAPLKLEKKTPVVGQTLGGVLMLAVACLACCVPLIAPVLLGLVAGTPLAAVLTFSSGWLIGGLVLLLAVAGTVGWYSYNKSTRAKTGKFQVIDTRA